MDHENAQLSRLEAVVVACLQSRWVLAWLENPKHTHSLNTTHTTKGVTRSKSTKPLDEMWRIPSPPKRPSLPLLPRMFIHPCSVCIIGGRHTQNTLAIRPPPPLGRLSLGDRLPPSPPPGRPLRARGGYFKGGGGCIHNAKVAALVYSCGVHEQHPCHKGARAMYMWSILVMGNAHPFAVHAGWEGD